MKKPPAALVRHLTMAVKRHLLDNGYEPAIMNDAVIRAGWAEFAAQEAAKAKPAAPPARVKGASRN